MTLTAARKNMSPAPYALVVADSVTEDGHRLTTVECRFHRYVLAEFNTHRVFSRNSASSRAIPVYKQIDKVRKTPAFPLVWPAEQRGMQGGEDLPPEVQEIAAEVWSDAADDAGILAERLVELRVHKSVVNRLLEPFLMQTVVVTSTAWANFLGLRDNELAQPEIAAPAKMIGDALEASTPRVVREGEWHLPYIQADEFHAYDYAELVQMSSARVARVSYLTQDGARDPHADKGLYKRLSSAWPMHGSPMEHVATPNPENRHEVEVWTADRTQSKTLVLPRYGNFLGWHQHRFDVEIAKDYQAFS